MTQRSNINMFSGCPSCTLIEPCASRRRIIFGLCWRKFGRCGWPHRIRLGTHSNPCDHYGCEGETREIVLRIAVISGCDASPVLELAEHSFDEISAFVGLAVQGIGRPA